MRSLTPGGAEAAAPGPGTPTTIERELVMTEKKPVMTGKAPVLVVGATGNVGRLVVENLLARGKGVRALVRPTSDASALESAGVEIARGDMLDPGSLVGAMDGVDSLVTTAIGYSKRKKGDGADTDVVGNRNLVDAAGRAGVRRFVLTGILTADQTPGVAHFWHKKLAEDYLAGRGVPFVSLRPGAFFEQFASNNALDKGRMSWFGSADVPLTFVLTSDLARYLAEAVDAPGVDGETIDIGWDRAASATETAEILGELLGREVRPRTVPMGVISAAGGLIGPFSSTVKDTAGMLKWFGTGRFVADTTRQGEVFGPVPTPREALSGFLEGRGYPASSPDGLRPRLAKRAS